MACSVVVCLRESRIQQQQRSLQVMLPVHQTARDQALFSGTAGAVGVPGTGSVDGKKDKQESPRPKQRGV